jgi:hypothetical protein
MLFGSDGYAKEIHYTDKKRIKSYSDVQEILETRKARFHPINKMMRMEREDLINERLVSDCKMCYSPYQLKPFAELVVG